MRSLEAHGPLRQPCYPPISLWQVKLKKFSFGWPRPLYSGTSRPCLDLLVLVVLGYFEGKVIHKIFLLEQIPPCSKQKLFLQTFAWLFIIFCQEKTRNKRINPAKKARRQAAIIVLVNNLATFVICLFFVQSKLFPHHGRILWTCLPGFLKYKIIVIMITIIIVMTLWP